VKKGEKAFADLRGMIMELVDFVRIAEAHPDYDCMAADLSKTW
jgi:hypothetical protein